MVILIAVLSPPLPALSGGRSAVAFVLVMMWSRTYLAAHWLTDTVAGAVRGSRRHSDAVVARARRCSPATTPAATRANAEPPSLDD